MSVAAVSTARRWLLLTLVLSGGILFAFRNRGWYPHDEGALGQSAERVLQGEVPHRDFAEPYTGALSYLHAAAFSVMGVRLTSLRMVVFLAATVWAWGLFHLGMRFTSPPGAAILALVAVVWSVPNYPASMPSWYNLFLATFGTLALARWIDDRQRRWLMLAGFLGGLSFLVKLSGLFFLIGAALFLVEASRGAKDASEAQVPRSAQGGRLMVTLILGLVMLMVWRPIAPLSPRFVVHFGMPVGFVVVGLAWREWSSPSTSLPERLAQLLRVGVPLAAGAAIAIVPALVAFAGAGALHAWYEGVFVDPFRRLDYANLPPPRLWVLVAVIPLLLVLRPLSDPAAPRWRTLSLVLAVLAVAGLVASALHDVPHRLVWQSLRGLVPVIGAVTAIVLVVPDKFGWKENRRLQVVLLGSVVVTTALVQFPYGSPIYFLYIAPLVILAAAAIISAEDRTPILIQGVVAGFYLLFGALLVIPGAPFSIGSSFNGWIRTERLNLPRAGLSVQPYEVTQYETLIAKLREVSKDRPIWAGPDAPEVYFLGAFRNQTRTLFDFLESSGAMERDLLTMLESKGVGALAINHHPDFTPPLTAETLAEVSRRYPNADTLARFIVRWRP